MRTNNINSLPTLGELMKESKEEGKKEATYQFVKMLLREDYPIAEITKLTNLSEHEIKEIQQSMRHS